MQRQALGQALWRFLVAHLAYRQGVVANNNVTSKPMYVWAAPAC